MFNVSNAADGGILIEAEEENKFSLIVNVSIEEAYDLAKELMKAAIMAEMKKATFKVPSSTPTSPPIKVGTISGGKLEITNPTVTAPVSKPKEEKKDKEPVLIITPDMIDEEEDEDEDEDTPADPFADEEEKEEEEEEEEEETPPPVEVPAPKKKNGKKKKK